jgi:hypothetical protein
MFDRGEIEAGEMIELHPIGIAQNGGQIGRFVFAVGIEADEMFVPPAIADLHHAQAVARGYQPHGLGIDRDGPFKDDIGGQVFFVEIYGHAAGLRRIGD